MLAKSRCYSVIFEQKYFELQQNGLGDNNLIYIAAVLGDLKQFKEAIEPDAYASLLIEEPEAHLHPQLQNILFQYFSKLNELGLQTFITSHSPTITAKSPLDSVIVLQEQNSTVSALSISNSNLSEDNKKYDRNETNQKAAECTDKLGTSAVFYFVKIIYCGG